MQIEPKTQSPRLPKPVRITEQVWPEGTVPVVSIFCITYNHEKFIRDAIEGFLMQETTFPVEIFIHDDASTDGTARIVKQYAERYPRLFWTVLQTENQWSKGNANILLTYLAQQPGQFIAMCEGDDYWTCQHKLQNQLMVFQDHAHILMCGAPCQVVDSETKHKTEISPLPCTDAQFIKAANYFPGCSTSPWIHTCTRLIPKYALVGIPEEFMIDTLMLHWLVTKYPNHFIAYIPEIAAAYRLHEHGFWSAMDTKRKSVALADIYSKAATLHSGKKKLMLLKKTLESLDLIRKDSSLSIFRRTPFVLKYWKVQLAVNRLLRQIKRDSKAY